MSLETRNRYTIVKLFLSESLRVCIGDTIVDTLNRPSDLFLEFSCQDKGPVRQGLLGGVTPHPRDMISVVDVIGEDHLHSLFDRFQGPLREICVSPMWHNM